MGSIMDHTTGSARFCIVTMSTHMFEWDGRQDLGNYRLHWVTIRTHMDIVVETVFPCLFSYHTYISLGSKIYSRFRDRSYSESSFQTGDVVGCFIRLNEVDPSENEIRFFKNGVDQGIAYSGVKEIPICVYFPAISLYGTVRIFSLLPNLL